MKLHDPATQTTIDRALERFAQSTDDELMLRMVFTLVHTDGRLMGLAQAKATMTTPIAQEATA